VLISGGRQISTIKQKTRLDNLNMDFKKRPNMRTKKGEFSGEKTL
jgi:hypothetical protein